MGRGGGKITLYRAKLFIRLLDLSKARLCNFMELLFCEKQLNKKH